MTTPQGKKTFLCVPIGIGLPLIFLALTGLSVAMALWVVHVGQNDVAPIFGVFSFLAFSIAVVSLEKAVWRVEVFHKTIICKGLIPRQTFSLEYEKCTIGMDWHKQNGNEIWWIYLCYGRKPIYHKANPANRINTLKCQPGFIRIMYREEVYEALMSVLPEKQKIVLETSRRYSGFLKQGKII